MFHLTSSSKTNSRQGNVSFDVKFKSKLETKKCLIWRQIQKQTRNKKMFHLTSSSKTNSRQENISSDVKFNWEFWRSEHRSWLWWNSIVNLDEMNIVHDYDETRLWILTKWTLFMTIIKFFVIIHFVDAKLMFELWCYIRFNREIIMKFENIKFISFEIVTLNKNLCDHWIMKNSEQNIASNQNYAISIYVRDILFRLSRLLQMIQNKF